MTSPTIPDALAFLKGYDAPLSDLERIKVLRDALAEFEREAVVHARSVGAPWTVIEERVGVSRPALRRRYGGMNERA